MAPADKSFDELLAEEQSADPRFREEWQRFAPARQLATALLRYRAEHELSQRALAVRLDVSQPRVAKIESGEHNPDVDTIVNVVRRLGIEFCLDVAPAGRHPVLVTARGRRGESVDHDRVAVFAASAA
jgi:DNA-binding XRE family transcriptional regulator